MIIKGTCSKCNKYGDLRPANEFNREGLCLKCLSKEEERRKEEQVRAETERQKELEEKTRPSRQALQNEDFLVGDSIASSFDDADASKIYNDLKFEVIKRWLRTLESTLELSNGYFDDEKARALSVGSKDILVKARAGSGKTTLIALKVQQLIKFYGVKPDEILVLAFNTKAAKEFRERINKYHGTDIATEANTLTFHALAKRIANTEKNLLIEGGTRQDRKSQIGFIQECFNAVEEKEKSSIETLFHLFLRSTSEKIRGAFRDDNEYYLYLRNQEYITIAGESVKSVGEKYIADFLFEHKISKNDKEIEYVYEHNIKKFLNTKYSYNPDFSLFYAVDRKKEQLQAVIEYFGFTENNPGYPGFFETKEKSKKYLRESFEKRGLFYNSNINFIEMSQDDFDIKKYGSPNDNSVRKRFEKIIQQRLKENGFSVSPRLTTKEILQKISTVEKRKEKLVGQITQFINKAQKISYDPDKIKEISRVKKDVGDLSMRNESFIKIACRVYDEYRTRLAKENHTDFDGLFVDAISKIGKDGPSCKIIYHGEKKIEDIKYILVDEYQDFSELFYQLIDEIRRANSAISFFCVGDDWQAINGFAGSDLRYFENFEHYFPGGVRTSLLTNYRSGGNIVKHSNLLMAGRGDGGKPDMSRNPGSVFLGTLERVEWRNTLKYIQKYNNDSKYRDEAQNIEGRRNRGKDIELSRYLKTIDKIVRTIDNKEVCLLFRANNLHGVNIQKVGKLIRKWNPRLSLTVDTAHGFKGKESDVVIIVDAKRKSFPKFHPDNELMEILGVTPVKILEEERRLFYVAITRAKESLYLLYEEEIGHTDFISRDHWKY